MTVCLWIVGVLVTLAVLIGLLRVGVRVTLRGGETTVDVTVGPLHFQVVPGRKKEEPEPKPEPAPEKAQPKPQKKPPRPTLAEIRDLIRTLWPPLKRALGRTRRSIRVDPFRWSVTVGGEEDPAEAAQLYGELHGAVWAGMPALEQLLVFRDPFVHIGIDFDARETTAEGTLGVSIRVGTLLRVLWTIGVPAVRWFLAFQKRHTTPPPAKPAPAADAAN